jgi:hypothetical protein
MKIGVEKRFGVWGVSIVQGRLQFHIPHENTKAYAEWMAKMFRIALRNHDAEVIEKYSRKRKEMA